MFRVVKQVFIALLNFSRSLATQCMYLNYEPWVIRPTLIHLNPFKLLFLISLDKCIASFSAVDDLLKWKCSNPNQNGVDGGRNGYP